jgi:hypothetical protein
MGERGRNDGDAARRPFPRPRLLCALIAVALAAGCRSNKSNLVEAELRTREREVRELRAELERAETFNNALQYDLTSRPIGCAPVVAPQAGGAAVDGPQAVMSGMIKSITLGRGTGGVDDDGVPGDEALQVVIVPQDTDGSAVKVPGNTVVMAYEVTPEGLKVPLNRWDVPATQLQRHWRSGLFTTGYFLTLPWKHWPSSEKMKVVVQFATLPNNRPFEAEKEVRIKVTAGGARNAVSPTPPVCLPIAPGAEGLPPPLQGPLLTPGAWLRERAGANVVEAAKRGLDERQPVRLLDPELRPED